MSRTRVAIAAVLGLFAAGCSPEFKVEGDPTIRCERAADCPDGFVCVEGVGLCRRPGDTCVQEVGGAFSSIPDGRTCDREDGRPGVCLAANCAVSECGDGLVDVRSEECDLGLGNDDDAIDGCRTDCREAYCGDGVPDSSEVCDDGNDVNEDACRVGCFANFCGDGFVNVGVEACDDGNTVLTDACPSGPSGTCAPARCGDGHVLAGSEECDDGNGDDHDHCPSGAGACRLPVCGDGYVRPGSEVCDTGKRCLDASPEAPPYFGVSCTTDGDCPDGTGPCVTRDGDGCTSSCASIEAGWSCAPATGCAASECGDGLVRGAEECDDDNAVPDDGCTACVIDDGYVCRQTANTASTCNRCGNLMLEGSEECDEGASDTPTCTSVCTEVTCGDGLVTAVAAEECEASSSPGLTCSAQCRTQCASGTADCDGLASTGCECSVDATPVRYRLAGALPPTSAAADDSVHAVATLRDGSIVFVASVSDGDPRLGDVSIPPRVAPAALIVRVNGDGTVAASRIISNACRATERCGVAVVPGSEVVVVGGDFSDTATFEGTCTSGPSVGSACYFTGDCDGGACTKTDLQATRAGAFVAAYDRELRLQWAVAIDGGSDERFGGIAASATGHVYVSGSYCGGALAACSALGGALDASEGSGDRRRVFLTRWSSSGALSWARHPTATGATLGSWGNGVAATADGGAVLAGRSGGGPLGFSPAPTISDLGILVARYDRNGVPTFASVHRAAVHAEGFGIAERPDGKIVVVGTGTPPMDLVAGTCIGDGASCSVGGVECTQPDQCQGADRLVVDLYEANGFLTSVKTVEGSDGGARAFAVTAFPDNSVLVAGAVDGGATLTDTCYLGSANGSSCGSGCPGGQCGFSVFPGASENVALLHYSSTLVLRYGTIINSADATSSNTRADRARSVARFQDGTAVVGGSFCVDAGSGCSIDLGVGGAIDARNQGAGGFLLRLSAH